MNTTLFVQKTLPLRQVTTTGRDGQQRVINFKGLLLTDGVNTVVCEATGDQAAVVEGMQLQPGDMVGAVLHFDVSETTDKDGSTRCWQHCRLLKIGRMTV